MTPFSVVLIAAAVLSTQVIHTISLPKKYRCVSSIKPLPEPDLELQESEPEPKPTSPSCIRRQQLNMPSKSQSSVQNSTTPIKILSQPSISNSSSSAKKLQPVTKSPSPVSNLHDTFKSFRLPLQFITSLLTALMPLDIQNTSSTISPLINLQMPLSLSTIHPYDLMPDSTNNSPISCGSLPDNTKNLHTSYDPVPASTNNSPAPCNSHRETTNNLPIPCNTLPDNTNHLPTISPNNLPEVNSHNARAYRLLCNLLLNEIRSLTLNTPHAVNAPESASGDTLPGSTLIYETFHNGNTPTDITNDLLTSTSNEPNLPCLLKPTVKVSKPCSTSTLKSTHIKSHSPSTFSAPVINPYPHSKWYPSNYESFDNLKNLNSDGVSLNPQEELILKILRSLNPTFNTSPPSKSK